MVLTILLAAPIASPQDQQEATKGQFGSHSGCVLLIASPAKPSESKKRKALPSPSRRSTRLRRQKSAKTESAAEVTNDQEAAETNDQEAAETNNQQAESSQQAEQRRQAEESRQESRQANEDQQADEIDEGELTDLEGLQTALDRFDEHWASGNDSFSTPAITTVKA